jgi:hypothetical protein
MSDVLPKIKLYIVLSLIALFMNLGILLTSMAMTDTGQVSDVNLGNVSINTGQTNNSENILQWFWRRTNELIFGDTNSQGFLSLGTAFLPFASILPLATLDIEPNIFAIISIGIVIISSIQTILLILLGLQLISNIIYHPDV